jgi:4'-phosphopantetheinyl transferase
VKNLFPQGRNNSIFGDASQCFDVHRIMPVEQVIEREGTKLCLWRISESLEELNQLIHERTTVQVFQNERRNRHYLSSRLLFESLLGYSEFKIIKDSHGKPHLEGGEYDISISHSGDYAVGLLSESGSCGVDIERYQDKIVSIGPRFCNQDELDAIVKGQEVLSMYLIWSIKESLYKLYGRKSVNFKKHLQVGAYDVQNRAGMVDCWIKKNGTSIRYSVHYQLFDKYVLSWVA